MSDAFPTRVAVQIEFVSAAPVEGTDRLLVTVRTSTGSLLSLRLTQPEAAELMALIIAERPSASAAPSPTAP